MSIDAAEAAKPKHPPLHPKPAEKHDGYTPEQMTRMAKEGVKGHANYVGPRRSPAAR